MKFNRISRRHLLQGAGGASLALPFLPSLMSRADAQSMPNPKFLVIYWNGHGGVGVQNMYPIVTNPAVAAGLTTQTLYAAQNHSMRYGSLTDLKTTRDSNLAFLASNPNANIPDDEGICPSAASFGIGASMTDLDAGAARVTPIIGSFVSDAMLGKMNLLSGLSLMFAANHNTAQTGNFCNMAGTTPTDPDKPIPLGGVMNTYWVPTIDSVVADSPGFYGSTPVAKSVVLNGVSEHSGYISAVPSANGIVVNGNRPWSVGEAFQLLFGSLIPPTQAQSSVQAKKGFILNSVYKDYTRVAKGAHGPGRRIGTVDRNRLEEFMASLHSLISGITAPPAECAIPAISPDDRSAIDSGDFASAPVDVDGVKRTLGLYNQLMTAAFVCGATQVFVMPMPGLLQQFVPEGSANPTFADGVTGPDPHQAYYHCHPRDNRQRLMVESHRFFFQYGFHDLAQRLDGMTAPSGNTMLDQSLLYWTHESGFITHDASNLPVMMAGSAGGAIKTGRFVDYRNLNLEIWSGSFYCGKQGMPYNRMLGTVLQAMGVPPSVYEVPAARYAASVTGRIPMTATGTVPGYGHPFNQAMSREDRGAVEYIYDYQLDDMSVPMPGIT